MVHLLVLPPLVYHQFTQQCVFPLVGLVIEQPKYSKVASVSPLHCSGTFSQADSKWVSPLNYPELPDRHMVSESVHWTIQTLPDRHMISESAHCTVQKLSDRHMVIESAHSTLQTLSDRHMVSGSAHCTVQRPPGRQIVSQSHCSETFSQADSKCASPLNCPVTARQAYGK